MARPQKFRHSREALNDPQIAAKLGGLVLDIEALRTKRKQIDDQIAAAYDTVDDAGFEKKFVRKVVSLRAKETDVRRDEEEGLEAYEFAIEKGVSLASARRKPVSSQSYAEAKGRGPATPNASNRKASDGKSAETPAALTDTQEQPETATPSSNGERSIETAGLEQPSAGHVSPPVRSRSEGIGSANEGGSHEVTRDNDQPFDVPEKGKASLAAREGEEAAAPISPSAAPPAVTVAEPQAPQSATVPIPNPQEPNSSPAADSPASTSSPEPGALSEADVPAFLRTEQRKSIADYRPNCLNPDACGASGLTHCYICRKAMEAASETEAA